MVVQYPRSVVALAGVLPTWLGWFAVTLLGYPVAGWHPGYDRVAAVLRSLRAGPALLASALAEFVARNVRITREEVAVDGLRDAVRSVTVPGSVGANSAALEAASRRNGAIFVVIPASVASSLALSLSELPATRRGVPSP